MENDERHAYNKYVEDEIDIIDLFRKIWKWKYITLSIIIITVSSVILYTIFKPDIYTVSAEVRLGKIANTLVEQTIDTQNYLNNSAFLKEDDKEECLSIMEISFKNNLIIQVSSDSPEIAFSCAEKAVSNLIERHKNIYDNALHQINENISLSKSKAVIDPVFFLETYTFPTYAISKPEYPIAPDKKTKRLKLMITVAFIASLFTGIFLSFLIEYINGQKKIQ